VLKMFGAGYYNTFLNIVPKRISHLTWRLLAAQINNCRLPIVFASHFFYSHFFLL